MSSFRELESLTDANLKKQLHFWMDLPIHSDWKEEILSLVQNNDVVSLQKRLQKSLNFGTAGVRSIMGFGFDRLNEFTVSKITLGLIQFIRQQYASNSIVVIGYDSRNHSKEFAQLVAKTFLYSKISPVLFEIPVPSPVLAYSTRFYNASVGVMITASHNPKEYNGYKIYNNHSGQFVSSETIQIFNEIQKISHIPLQDLMAVSLDSVIPPKKEFFDNFFDTIKKNIPQIETKKQIPIVYSPLFGTGKWFGEQMIQNLGGKLIIVEEQNMYNGDFPGCVAPNPEKHENFDLAIEYAHKNNVPLCVLTDPDADRIGIWENGYFFNGNEIGILLSAFLLEHRAKKMPNTLVSSVVSTKMTQSIADFWGATYKKTLTGFKYIGDIIQKNPESFLLGFEESYGFLIGNYIQDKDAIGTLGLISVIANTLYSRNETFLSFLEEIYDKIAFSKTRTIELTLSEEKMKIIMKSIEGIQQEVFQHKVIEIFNFLSQEYFLNGIQTPTQYFEDLETIPLMIFTLENFLTVAIRPSGTEPKLKIYIELFISREEKVDKREREYYIQRFENLIKQIENLQVF